MYPLVTPCFPLFLPITTPTTTTDVASSSIPAPSQNFLQQINDTPYQRIRRTRTASYSKSPLFINMILTHTTVTDSNHKPVKHLLHRRAHSFTSFHKQKSQLQSSHHVALRRVPTYLTISGHVISSLPAKFDEPLARKEFYCFEPCDKVSRHA